MMLSHRSINLWEDGVSDSSKSQSMANETAGLMEPLRGCGTGRCVSGLKVKSLSQQLIKLVPYDQLTLAKD